ncbi:MAG: helix-turn-helix transcriptional regulator, partial [bacterium]
MDNKLSIYIRYRAIDQCINEKGIANITQLADAVSHSLELEHLDEEIVLNDIEKMKDPEPEGYGAPIEYDEKKAGYYYRDKNFSLDKIPLNDEENEMFRLAVQYLDQVKSHKSIKGLRALIQKIINALRILHLGRKNGDLDFVQTEISQSYGGSQFLVPLIHSIQEKKVVRIYYQPFYEDKPYFINVHPYLLKEFRNRWYLIGLNDTKGELRTYGLDRIWEVEEIEQEYIPKNFKARDYFRNTVGIISPMGEPPEIRIEVLRNQAQYLITQPLHESQFIESENEEKVIFGYKVHPTYEFKSLILAMGSDVKVLMPVSFKKEVLRELNDAILGYAG